MSYVRAHENPFRSEKILSLSYHFAHGSWDEILNQLAHLQYRASVVGKHGSGKTTFLHALAEKLQTRGLRTSLITLRANESKANAEKLRNVAHTESFILLDGAEQLSQTAWLAFRLRTRTAPGLIETAHQSPRLPILWECSIDNILFQTLLNKLGPFAQSEAIAQAAARLLAQYDGNCHLVFRELYHSYCHS